MADLQSIPAEIHFTLTIKRAATGEVINVPMVGHVVPQIPAAEPLMESSHGSDPLDCGPKCGD